MDKNSKTTEKLPKKLPAKPFTGSEGNTFSKENQPSSELKKQGWEKWREKRFLTHEIVKQISTGKNLNEYVKAIIKLAKEGNPKAIEVVNRGIEDASITVEGLNKDGDQFNITLKL